MLKQWRTHETTDLFVQHLQQWTPFYSVNYSKNYFSIVNRKAFKSPTLFKPWNLVTFLYLDRWWEGENYTEVNVGVVLISWIDISWFYAFLNLYLLQLKAEIQRCEEKKRQNIRVFVEAIREELASWWSKCCYGKLQRQQFRAYFSDCYTEDLLELHELEIEKLKRYFNENM